MQSLYAQKLNDGLSANSVRQIHAVLHKALSQSVKYGYVPRNVADSVQKPRIPKREMKCLNAKETLHLLKATSKDRLHAMYVLAVTTGMRQGELFGLRWNDVDLKSGVISVSHSLEEGKGSTYRLVEPKTSKSRRTVRLTSVAVKALKAHKRHQAKERLKASTWKDEWNLVFCQTDGGPLRKQNVVRRSFKPLLRQAKLPDIRFHDLRHTAATLMLRQRNAS